MPATPLPRTPSVRPSDRLSGRALMVWSAGILAYVLAITGRTSLGVAGVEAMDHFDISASRLAVFSSVQVGVYALAQIPMGMLIDRFGPRRMLVVGALLMGAGQVLLGVTGSYAVAIVARVIIGSADATAFLSVMRILPAWIPMRRTPLFTQLTGGLGYIGQFISAVPFTALLHVHEALAHAERLRVGHHVYRISVNLLHDDPALRAAVREWTQGAKA